MRTISAMRRCCQRTRTVHLFSRVSQLCAYSPLTDVPCSFHDDCTGLTARNLQKRWRFKLSEMKMLLPRSALVCDHLHPVSIIHPSPVLSSEQPCGIVSEVRPLPTSKSHPKGRHPALSYRFIWSLPFYDIPYEAFTIIFFKHVPL